MYLDANLNSCMGFLLSFFIIIAYFYFTTFDTFLPLAILLYPLSL